ncbi:MAG TPA: MFS transporter, partial [Candidatus Dormibacteraeota bacterium]|nr:MFS transporter [Candidatus Dormibacteraeota bacterium]
MATRNGASWSTVLTALGCGLVGGVALGATAPVGLGLQRDLDLSLEALGWAASAITAVPAALGLAAGWWIRRPGPRRALVLGLLVLAVAGGVTAAAPNGAVLLAGRFVQGVGYLLVVVASPIAIAGATDGAARRLALAIWTTVIPAGLALAAAAGGAVLAVAGWRAWLGLASAAALLLVVPAARVTIGGAPPGAAARPAALGVRPKRQTDLRRPCTPSRGPASAVLGHAVDGAPCAPRRRPTIWGTWP